MASQTFPEVFISPSVASTDKEVAKELLPLLRVYKDGSVERLLGSPVVPPSSPDPETGVSTKDITISTHPNISARIYLPNLPQTNANDKKLPILVYFHGGGFCLESAFSFLDHRYLNRLASETGVLAVSVEYRLAPESPLPAAYDDSWAALQWVANHSGLEQVLVQQEPWLVSHGDFGRLYIGGDSAGANIVHNVALRAGTESESLPCNVKIHGAFLAHPYFWGSKPIGSEPKGFENALERLVWDFAYPSASWGIDNLMINPVSGGGAPSLAGLGCSRMLVCVAGKDRLRERGVWYYEAVKESGWKGEVELFEVEEEDHAFHIYNIDSHNANVMIKRLASFLV
ncbi:2-hydroxyisoflavanone dehydratase [Morus notabilis]|uniref:2-hydroxyisoflavanone dehydratase n=1 Tax=Morus notabilis TaxID=981085 RepID=UPI000CED1AA3|nr:2-hydroxyisoflavanone dehydratase [Morus notabilis]